MADRRFALLAITVVLVLLSISSSDSFVHGSGIVLAPAAQSCDTSIAFEQTVSGRIDDAKYSVYYCFTGASGQWISTRMVVQSGDLVSLMRVYSPNGSLLVESEPESYINFLTIQLTQSGTHVLEATYFHDFVQGGDFRLRLENGREAALGDINRDCNVDDADQTIILDRFGSNDQDADLDLSGEVNSLDLNIFLSNYGTSCPQTPNVDLEVTTIETIGNQSICIGSSPTFRAFIRNNGSAESGFIEIMWNADGQIFDGGHNSIPAESTDTHDHIWQNITQGQHSITFIADPANHISESDEGNNEYTLSFTAVDCSPSTNTPTATATPTTTATNTATSTPTPSSTQTDVSTSTSTVMPTATNTPITTNTPTSTASPTPTHTENATTTSTSTATNTPITTSTPTSTASPTPTHTENAGTTSTPTATNTPTPDPMTLEIAAASADKAEGNSGSTTFTFIVTRNINASGTVEVDYAVSGSGANPANAADFAGGVLPSGKVTLAAGELSKLVTINVSGDTNVEQDEGFTVTLSNATGGAIISTASASGIIRNDDAAAPMLPPAPTLNAITNPEQDGVYTVSWTAVANATSYELQEKFNSDPFNTIYAGPMTMVDLTDKADGTWCYRVYASNADGSSSWGNTECTTVATQPSPFDCNNVSPIPPSECEALKAIYNGTNGDNWTDNRSWLVTNTPCAHTSDGWYRLHCDTNVWSIDLYGNNLQGPIPQEIGDLPQLEELDWSGNPLSGGVPEAIGNLTQLWYLNLSNTQLSGPLPRSLMNITALRDFRFDGTSLCEPSDAEFQAWLNNVSRLEARTNAPCTPPPPDTEPPPAPDGKLTCAYDHTSGGSHYYKVTYSWNAVTDNGTAGMHEHPYWSQISEDSNFSTLADPGWHNSWDNVITRTSTIAFIEDTELFGHVRARDANDNRSNWSSLDLLFINQSNCSGESSSPPTANFSANPTSGSNTLTVNFTDQSTGDIRSWQWDFGDGSTSTQQHPSHIYANVGSYTVSLIVSGPGGSDTETKTTYITVGESQPGTVCGQVVWGTRCTGNFFDPIFIRCDSNTPSLWQPTTGSIAPNAYYNVFDAWFETMASLCTREYGDVTSRLASWSRYEQVASCDNICKKQPHSISGRVTDSNGNPISGVTLSDGAGHTTTTNVNGEYTLGLPAGTYTITPSKDSYTFSPPAISNITMPPDATGVNFNGTPLQAEIRITNFTLTEAALEIYPPLTQPEATYELKSNVLWIELTNGQIPFRPPSGEGHYTIQVLLKQDDGQIVREYEFSDRSTLSLDTLFSLGPEERKNLRISNMTFFDKVQNGKLEVIFKPDPSLNLKDSSLPKTITVGDHPDSLCACIAEIAQAIIKAIGAKADKGILSWKLADLGAGLIKKGCKQDIRGALKEIAKWVAGVLLESFGNNVGKITSVGIEVASELGRSDIACLKLVDWLTAWAYELIRRGFSANLIMSESPVYPLVTNTYGQRTGFLDNGQIIEEIPESRAVVIGEKRIIMYTGQDTVNAQVVGYASGTMNLHTVFYQPGATGITLSYENVQVTQGMKATLTSTDEYHLLNIDANGDGTVDQSYSPDKIEFGFHTDHLYAPSVAK